MEFQATKNRATLQKPGLPGDVEVTERQKPRINKR